MRFICYLVVSITLAASSVVQAAPLSIERPATTELTDVQRARIICGPSGCQNDNPPVYDLNRNRSGYSPYRPSYTGRQPYQPGYSGTRPYSDIHRSPLRAGRAHQNWCQSRYRSYNAGTNRFSNNDGYSVVCRSPFDQSGY